MLNIRFYEEKDLEDLAALMADLGYPTDREQMGRRMKRIMEESSYFTFVAVKDNRVVGMIGCREAVGYEFDDCSVQINALVTKQEVQGQGIGRALLQNVEQWAKERGAKGLFLTSGNKPERKYAHEFYQQLGFIITVFPERESPLL
ncbi:N-acetylglutamate synthase, GNAT family [Paenibacillus uliginis N3/975]|uniref:N-acetylglutamate synthase, GNAT family n=1 Tax=Paenibacillus uliginis N3/975 TaxID=1313296 RepID=A0A1X7H6Y6_9BACL|nr:GNAT family N-acetyltransferase [Paenibacillus uliginis]SMF80855.1 N-acetylglutamate synthase, GNAT family [Paenibacillus uliginis N3/975]